MLKGLILLFLLTGCGRDVPPPSPALVPPPAPAETGRFVAEYEPATAPDLRELRTRLVASRLLDTVAAGLNDTLRMRENVVIASAECGEPNAYYRPDARRVTLCYELLADLSRRFRRMPEADILVAGTTAFVLLHEVGHALIHVLDLPTTGREEDAVDLATLSCSGRRWRLLRLPRPRGFCRAHHAPASTRSPSPTNTVSTPSGVQHSLLGPRRVPAAS
jgi:hypothetical protein